MKVLRSEARRSPFRARAWCLALGALLLGSGGCYSYQPQDGAIPPAPETVRIELTGEGRDVMEQRRGLALETFEGRVLEQNGDDLLFEARLPANLLAYSDRAVIDTLELRRQHIRAVDVKQFSMQRTVVGSVVGVAALAGVFAIVEAAVSSDEEGGEGPDGNIELSVVPFVTTVLGWLR